MATFKEGKNPDINSIYKPYTDDQRTRVQDSIARTYDLFTSRVAQGRGISQEKVNELGRGHVYAGKDAISKGLVDRMGGLEDAVAFVRAEAKIRPSKDLDMRVLPREARLIDLILSNVGDPFAGAGPVRSARAKAQKRRRDASLAGALPQLLTDTLAQLPLSLLYLEQNKAHAVMPYVLIE